MGSSAKPEAQGADSQGVPNLPRVLSPDEFDQARMLGPDELAKAKFPVLPPPYVPSDATRRGVGGGPQGSVDPTKGVDSTGLKGRPEPGLSGILTRQVINPIKEHPLMAAGITAAQFTPLAPLVNYAMMGAMGKDILDYSAQKAAEMSLPPDDRKQTEADPERISGEQAGTEAVMMGIGGVAHKVSRALAKSAAADATKAAQAKIATHVGAIEDAFKTMFAPASRTPDAAGMANIMRATTGEKAMEFEQASFKLDEFRRAINPLPDVDRLGFIDNIEGGKAQVTPEFQKAADTMRQIGDDTWAHIVKLSPDAAGSYLEDYFPHRWKDPEKAKVVFGTADAPTPRPGADTGPSIARPRTASGRLKNLSSATPDELANEYAMSKGQDAPLTARLETELSSRGINPDEAFTQGKARVEASQQDKVGVPQEPPPDNQLEEARRAAGGKRPMEGSKNFLKRRTIPTTAEGIALGLEPVSTNPVDLFLLDLRNKQKFIMAHETMTQGKDAGYIKFFPGQMDEGYTAINDKVATVYGPRHPDTGMSTVAGRYGAPESVAKIINNYLSPGLQGNPIYDAYRGLGNTLNQAQLGLSAFHLGMTSIDATVSRSALGLQYLWDGLKGGDADAAMMGVKKLATSGFAPWAAIGQGTVGDLMNAKFGTNVQWGLGAKIRAAYLNPESATPEMRALANAVKEAGGRVRMDSFYENSAPQKFMEAWHQEDAVGMAKMALPAFFEVTAKPLMEHIVPLQKMQVFGEMAQKILGEMPPETSLAERRAALSSAWDSVDNRMGQLVYDNLFWSKTFKDLSMASVRSVGWNIGTIRELGGGVGDVAKMAGQFSRGEAMTLTHKAAYAVMLPLTVGMYGAIYQYLRTGKGPEELKDYFKPKTGEEDADGNPERVQLPSYMKDVFAYQGHTVQTFENKAGPLPQAIFEMLHNKDFYGDEIRNPDDPAVKQIQQEALWIAKQALPFSVTNMMEQSKRADVGTPTKLGNWFGITPAHREDVRTPAQNEMADIAAKRGHTELTPEQQEAAASRRDLLGALRGNNGMNLQDAVSKAVNAGGLVPADLGKLLKRAGSTPAQERFRSLTTAQALDVFAKSTPDEQAKFAQLLFNKLDKATK